MLHLIWARKNLKLIWKAILYLFTLIEYPVTPKMYLNLFPNSVIHRLLVNWYQRLLKWFLIPPCLILSYMRYVLRVKWSNPERGVALSPTPRCSSYWKESLLVVLDYCHQLYLSFSYLYTFLPSRFKLLTKASSFFSFTLYHLFLLLISYCHTIHQPLPIP